MLILYNMIVSCRALSCRICIHVVNYTHLSRLEYQTLVPDNSNFCSSKCCSSKPSSLPSWRPRKLSCPQHIRLRLKYTNIDIALIGHWLTCTTSPTAVARTTFGATTLTQQQRNVHAQPTRTETRALIGGIPAPTALTTECTATLS